MYHGTEMSKTHRDLLKTAVRTGSADAQELAVQAGPAAVPWLQRQMLNENSRIRLTAFYCLLRIGGPHILDTCVRALYDTQPNIREGAVREIYEHGDCTHVKPLLDAHANSPDIQARYDIALAIGRLDSTFRSVPELKYRWTRETSPDAEEALMVALARLGEMHAQAEFVSRLHQCFKRRDYFEREINAVRRFRRYFNYVEYIHDQWLLKPLAPLLNDETPLIYLRTFDIHRDSISLRACDLAVTLAGSISGRTFTFPIEKERIYNETQRSEIGDYLNGLENSVPLNSLENSVAARCQDDLAMNQLATKHFQEILRRGNLLARRVTFSALNMAPTFERLTSAHLCLGLCSRDWSLAIRTLRVAVDMKSFVKSVQDLANEKSQPGEIQTIFKLACAIAPADKPITTAHLLAAVLLDSTNKISRYLRDCNVDVRALVRKRLAHVLSGPLRSDAGGIEDSEMNARMWLLELIPNEGCDYLIDGVIEIRSSLYPERVYRIHRGRQTEIFEHGRPSATACIRTVDYKIPRTDRVLAEYFLLKGNERGYLRTAISTYV
jgi:hypothetical protein